MLASETTWKVLLIGGSSGVGKSSLARQLGRRFGTPWMQVDDLRLALQRSRVILPEQTEAPTFSRRPHRSGTCLPSDYAMG